MAELKREAARQGRTMSDLVETALRLMLGSQRKRAAVPQLPTFRSGGALVEGAVPRRPLPRDGRTLVLAVDTNVLVYAADANSPFHAPCRAWLERQRARPDAWYTTWSILYEFFA